MTDTIRRLSMLIASGIVVAAHRDASARDAPHDDATPPEFGPLYVCPVKPPGSSEGGVAGGGMINDGWDGDGANAVVLYWHVVNTSNDLAAGQRQALIDAMQAWANVVQITFVELPLADQDLSTDWSFQVGDHCGFEPDECDDDDCPFDGPNGTIAHAAFPPGGLGTCGPASSEPRSGDVHFDDAERWEQDGGSAAAVSMTLVAAHELGHALGLLHDTGPGGPHIMRPGFSGNDVMQAPSASDTAHIQTGYAAGTGAVITLEQSGVWVDGGFAGIEQGTPTAPFDTVAEGVAGVPPFSTQVVVHVQAGAYPETAVLDRPMVLVAENGTVQIGP